MCFPKSNNPPVNDPHRLPYVLDHDKMMHWLDPQWAKDGTPRKLNEKNLKYDEYMNLHLNRYLQGAYQIATNICQRSGCSCTTVTIKVKIENAWNNLWSSLPPPVEFEVKSTTTQAAFDKDVKAWEKWWPDPPRENIPDPDE